MPAAKKTSKTANANASKREENKPVPAWPRFEHTPVLGDLRLNALYPGQIVTIPGFWTSSLCKKYVKFLSTLPLVTTPGKPKRGEAVRVNDRYQIDDPVFAERLWSETGLKDLVLACDVAGLDGVTSLEERRKQLWGGLPIGLNPNIRVYRYTKGQYFDQHYDDSNTLTHPGPPPKPSKTTWTFLLYLTSPADGCIGGETVFYPEPPQAGKKAKKAQPTPDPVVVGLETGMALLHRHGQECMLHEGREVVDDEKWVIRSDLCVGK